MHNKALMLMVAAVTALALAGYIGVSTKAENVKVVYQNDKANHHPVPVQSGMANHYPVNQ